MKTSVEKIQETKKDTVQRVQQEPSTGGEAAIADYRPRTAVQCKLRSVIGGANDAGNPIQRRGHNTGLPDTLKSGIENLSGYSMDDVKVHYNSNKPNQLQAHAYAQGTDIHLAPGQEKHLPHEAWHVVQQKQGRVEPTRQFKSNININDDAGLEKEADVMGKMALQRKSFRSSDIRLRNNGNAPTAVTQLRERPILANERDLLDDTEQILNGNQRANMDANLIDTTYDNLTDNLLLDINLMYEEELQREIEHDSHFLKAIKKVVNLIHHRLDIGSVSGLKDKEEDTTDFREHRIGYVLGWLNAMYGRSDIDIPMLETNNWNHANLGNLIANTEENNRKARGYVKLAKMLTTQLPYFGGSVEYKENRKESLEYWIYHMSTLTKDPDRSYAVGETGAKLPKPLKDYRTHGGAEGLVPYHNERNLGTGVAEADWNELPTNLQNLILVRYNQFIANLPPTGSRRVAYNALLNVNVNNVNINNINNNNIDQFWNALNEDQKKSLYGDMLQIPWSTAHLHANLRGHHHFEQDRNTQNDTAGYMRKHPGMTTPGLQNVVGVRGNILETPQLAAARYRRDLEALGNRIGKAPLFLKNNLPAFLASPDYAKAFPEIPNTWSNYFFTNVNGLTQNFQEKHQNWFNDAKQNKKPIIGGISGHTLGYLNLYEEALGAALRGTNRIQYFLDNNVNLASMEDLRACMLAGLVGDKRHHSYDEVMTASHGMPTHQNQNPTLQYNHRDSYRDVTESTNNHIRESAEKAQRNTATRLKDPNTVFNSIIQNREDLNEGQLTTRLISHIIEDHLDGTRRDEIDRLLR
ncbi:eCIS core domain-containing protein [Aquimarina mytili]|uniref:DUF4157 domain-containing protein n=1 Tax=Aquimarina mytili TaxID=874423 RepID=A0A937D9M4_9FLAO|nr:DUF4157 domain-containing protein [Aquimarina mytili]MBL0683862.1 DUF4157 domain-containing protein [Aquimarina mytili]